MVGGGGVEGRVGREEREVGGGREWKWGGEGGGRRKGSGSGVGREEREVGGGGSRREGWGQEREVGRGGGVEGRVGRRRGRWEEGSVREG